ncbi:MAG: hypothetical protein U1F57_12145 [bacterium]
MSKKLMAYAVALSFVLGSVGFAGSVRAADTKAPAAKTEAKTEAKPEAAKTEAKADEGSAPVKKKHHRRHHKKADAEAAPAETK